MSHIVLIMGFRSELKSEGLNEEQVREAVTNVFVNAVTSYVFIKGGLLTKEIEDHIWAQLDKWHKVSPINGRVIIAAAVERINGVRLCLASKGYITTTHQVGVGLEKGDGEIDYFDITAVPVYNELFCQLVKELENGCE